MATSGAVELTVVTLPAHALSFSNCVYMNREAMIEMGLLSTSPHGSFVELTKSKHIFKLAYVVCGLCRRAARCCCVAQLVVCVVCP